MFISEIFHSLQGEGLLIGVPSVFVRTSGCNLRCHWCDTPYASWNPEGETFSVDEIMERVTSYQCHNVVLTGGEPTIAAGFPELTMRLREAGHHITIETAGTVMPDGIVCDLASISPKLSNSTPDEAIAGAWKNRHEKTRYQPDVLRAWLKKFDSQLKFVVTSAEDLSEIEALLADVGPVSNDRVLLMPEGTTVDVLRKRSPLIAKLCLERGFRFAPRLQIELYGNTRGT